MRAAVGLAYSPGGVLKTLRKTAPQPATSWRHEPNARYLKSGPKLTRLRLVQLLILAPLQLVTRQKIEAGQLGPLQNWLFYLRYCRLRAPFCRRAARSLQHDDPSSSPSSTVSITSSCFSWVRIFLKGGRPSSSESEIYLRPPRSWPCNRMKETGPQYRPYEAGDHSSISWSTEDGPKQAPQRKAIASEGAGDFGD